MTIGPGKPRKTKRCVHLGQPTGETVACRTCGGQDAEVSVYRCEIEGTTVLHKPTPVAGRKPWDGAVCVTCEFFSAGGGRG